MYNSKQLYRFMPQSEFVYCSIGLATLVSNICICRFVLDLAFIKDGCMVSNDKYRDLYSNKKLSYYWETVRRESMPRIAEMDVEMTT